MTGRAAVLAVELLAGRIDAASAECAASADLAGEVAVLVTEVLVGRAEAPWDPFTQDLTAWTTTQPAVRALAGLPGVDDAALARGFLGHVLHNLVPGAFVDLPLIGWEGAPRSGGFRGCSPEGPESHFWGVPHITRGMFALPGADGAAWFTRLAVEHPQDALTSFADMRLHRFPEARHRPSTWCDEYMWSDADWALRLDALASAAPGGRRFLDLSGVGDTFALPPASSSASQVHCACVHGARMEDHLVRQVAGRLRAYRTRDDARDADLVWWHPATEMQRVVLRGLLEVAGPAGTRSPLVAAAHARGLINDDLAAFLVAPLPHPDWAEGEVPWTLAEVSEPISIRVPPGRLALGDLSWIEGPAAVIDVPVDTVTARVVTAVHPLFDGPHNAAIDLVIAPGGTVVSWRRLTLGDHEPRGGFTPAFGTAGVGADAAFMAVEARDGDNTFYETYTDPAAVLHLDEGDAGTVLALNIAAQHAACAVFAGESADGSLVRLVIDLELLDADPEGADGPVWEGA